MGTFDTSTREAREAFERQQLERRLQSVGAVRVDEDAADVSLEAEEDPEAAVAAAEEAEDVDVDTDVAEEDEADDVQRGEDVYAAVCMACHDAGLMDALRLDDEDGWVELMDERGGLDELVENAITGIGGMPARGGDSDLSDEEVRAAVVYMLEEAGLDVADD
nr:c-type cytochrome [Methylonatrum kenyense]